MVAGRLSRLIRGKSGLDRIEYRHDVLFDSAYVLGSSQCPVAFIYHL